MELVKSIDEVKKYFIENYDPKITINISATAKALNVSRVTLYKWIEEIKEA